jgi:type I restriction enzyme S subunit
VSVYPGDLILSNSATPGIPMFMGIEACIHDGWLLLRNFRGLDKLFAYYLLLHDRPALVEQGSGSVFTNLKTEILKKHRVRLPMLAEQQAIACVLGSLDDKIELLRRMSETLEQMARALFKSWFIDFDPVRRNAARARNQPSSNASRHPLPLGEGRGEGSVEALDRLFPDRLVDSELGEIPEGWKVGKLGDVADHPRRSIQPSQIEPQTPYIALEHMPRRCIALSDWSTSDGLESSKFSFRKGEILFGKLRPYFHKVGIAPLDGVCSTDIVVIAPRTPFYFALVMGIVSSDEFIEYTNAGSTGTKMPRTSWAEMARYDIALPPKALAQAFTDRVVPEVDRIIAAIHESRTLAALRDALLPKLISGELRVKDAERFLREIELCPE